MNVTTGPSLSKTADVSQALELRSVLAKSDPVTDFVINRLKLRPWLATAIFAGVLYSPILVLVAGNNLWQGNGNWVGFLKDYAHWVFVLLAVPTTVFYFFWMPEAISGVLNDLETNRVIKEAPNAGNPSKLATFEARFAPSYSHWLCILVALGAVAIYMVFLSVPVQQQYRTWQTTGPVIFWYTVFFWLVMYSAGALVIVRGFVTIYWLNRLFRECEAVLRVLHPDGAGGLSPLGGFSVKVGYLIGVYGIGVVASTLSSQYVLPGNSGQPLLRSTVWPLLVFYVILAPVAFFAPIAAAGKAMKQAKAAFLLKIADQFEVDSARLVSVLDADSATLAESVEKIEQLKKLHELGSRFPVWPFNTGNIVRFFTSVLLPLLLAFLPALISLIAK